MKALKMVGWGCLGLVALVALVIGGLFVFGLSKVVPEVSENDKGVTALNNGDYTTAIADFNAAIKMNPAVGKTYMNRAGAEAKQGDTTDALADLNKSIQLDATDPTAFNNRGQLEGNTPAAMADFNQAIALDPKNDMAYNNRGLVKYYTGDTQGALADLNQALAINPKNTLASSNLAKIEAWSSGK